MSVLVVDNGEVGAFEVEVEIAFEVEALAVHHGEFELVVVVVHYEEVVIAVAAAYVLVYQRIRRYRCRGKGHLAFEKKKNSGATACGQ